MTIGKNKLIITWQIKKVKYNYTIIAEKFSQENRIPECKDITPFGFHYCLPLGVILKSWLELLVMDL